MAESIGMAEPWTIQVAITSQSRRFLVGISSLQQRSGGVGEVRSKSKAKAKSEAKA